MKTRYVLSCLLLGSALSVSAQKMAVKSNLLSAANGALNAGVEYAFGPKSTFDLSGSIRPWKRTEGYVNKYWLIQPRITATHLPEDQRQFLGSLSQRSAVQHRRGKRWRFFATLPLAERAPVCRLADRWRHKLRISHHAQPPLEYRSFRRCRV